MIRAVDYDLGRNLFAYNDLDTASYHYTPGVNTQGNRGYAYRNDGVDIRKDNNEFVVFHIENGEWLQYTAWVASAGNYTLTIKIKTEADSTSAKFNVSSNGKALVTNVEVPSSGAGVILKNIRFPQGENRIRITFVKGGAVFSEMIFERK